MRAVAAILPSAIGASRFSEQKTGPAKRRPGSQGFQ
jgi:hypothetical protein